MEEEKFQPRKGFYAEWEVLKGLSGWAFTVGFNKSIVQHSMNGYENPITHQGDKFEFFIMVFNRTFAVGYNTVKPVNFK